MATARLLRYASTGIPILAALSGVTHAALTVDFTPYARNSSIDDNLDIYWTVDADAETFRVAIHAKAASGWAGFGISEMGGMEGADIVYYETETGTLTDAYALEPGQPVEDECSQDWTLISAEVDATEGLVFEAKRAWDTGDSQDRVLVDDTTNGGDPTRVIAAWGDDSTISYHGDNRARAQEFLFADAASADTDPLADITSSGDATYFEVTADEFTIPKTRTFYKETCLPLSELPADGEFHVIGFEGVVQESTEEFVHHLVVKAFYDSDDCGGSCNDKAYTSESFSTDTSTSFCDNTTSAELWAWAPGVSSIATPDNVGFLFSSSNDGFLSIGVQTHYNNPDEIGGMTDSSGVRVYYTDELRQYDAGSLRLGDPYLALYGQALEDGKSSYTFSCPSSCTETYFEEESVTVFGHTLHMHQTGQHMVTRQYRNDELVYTSEVEYYSFDQAGAFMDNTDETLTIESFHLFSRVIMTMASALPANAACEDTQIGDRFETICYYDSDQLDADELTATNGSVVWGAGSENEMCIDYVWYYPVQPIPDLGTCGVGFCGGSLDETTALDDDSDLERSFGYVETCDSSC